MLVAQTAPIQSSLDMTYVLLVVGGLVGAITFLFTMLMRSRDREHELVVAQLQAEKAEAVKDKEDRLKEKARELEDLEGIKRSYKEIAEEAKKFAADTVNFYRQRDGLPPIKPLAIVIPESHSPSTAKQREVAEIATLRAEMAGLNLAQDLPPRPTPEHADEKT